MPMATIAEGTAASPAQPYILRGRAEGTTTVIPWPLVTLSAICSDPLIGPVPPLQQVATIAEGTPIVDAGGHGVPEGVD